MIVKFEKIIPRKIFPIYLKYKTIFWYLFFGGITTLVNIIVFYICYEIINISNVSSNVIAWAMAVFTAYMTNRKSVFNSKANTPKMVLKESALFIMSRLLTLVIDLVIMMVAVDIMEWSPLLWKIIANIVVIISNYILSKLVVFR